MTLSRRLIARSLLGILSLKDIEKITMVNTGSKCTTFRINSQQLYTPEQVREHESSAAEQAGISQWQLLERAGQAVFKCLKQRFPIPNTVAVLCGGGNNGGDGYVVATLAQKAGYQVRVFASEDMSQQSLEAALALNLWLETGYEVGSFADWAEASADVVIDALLGTGLNKPVRDDLANVINDLNQRKLPVIAVDIPSGLHGDTGQVQGYAVKAAHTVSFVGMKRGLYTGAARDYCGQLWFADLGVLKELRAHTEPAAWRLDAHQLSQWLPARLEQSHKGHFGHLLIIGGQRGMAGALRMAGEAALRSGAGKVTLVCEPGQEAFMAGIPELMVLGLDVSKADDAAYLEQLMQQVTHIAIGPGLGQRAWGQKLWLKALAANKPMVVDADALNLLAQTPLKRDNWVLTPHPGEAARLLATDTETIEVNRWQSVQALQEKYGGCVVLKGSGSLIQSSDKVAVCAAGTPALATAGSGDVLTGIVGGLMAQSKSLGLSPWETTCAAVLVHSLAGESAASHIRTASSIGAASNLSGSVTRGLRATDLMAQIVQWVNPDEFDKKPGSRRAVTAR